MNLVWVTNGTSQYTERQHLPLYILVELKQVTGHTVHSIGRVCHTSWTQVRDILSEVPASQQTANHQTCQAVSVSNNCSLHIYGLPLMAGTNNTYDTCLLTFKPHHQLDNLTFMLCFHRALADQQYVFCATSTRNCSRIPVDQILLLKMTD